MRSIKLASVAALAGAVMLAGCGKKADDVSLKNASVETVANSAKGAVKIEPGQWEMSFLIDKMEIPGMPAGSNPPQQAQKASTCITPEQAAKPAGDLFAGKGAGDCKFDTFTMNDGKMNATMSCKMPNMPGQSKTVMSGNYASTHFDNEVTSTVSGMPGGQTVTIHATSSGRRLGECPAKSG
ncbi:DUF3617 domain-containing protein [Sphingomonas crusticola]|uniref:DUF3617 domain-containing protein n=1 Tax=Sphingomonas crusticola TaxID=1697973 RepID=UPI0013C3064D|nr:DUF3617 domain-containing protein [Sphingomonas crusticola]